MNITRSNRATGVILALSLLLAAACLPAYGQRATRVRFARGWTSAVVTGNLKGFRDERSFVIRVRKGQRLRTESVGSNYITIYVKGPDGSEAGDSDASCNDRREVWPTVAGDYRITVVQCRKADPWRGRFRFRVSVIP